MDEAGVLGHVSDRYRSDSFTKAALREQLRLLFSSTTPSNRRFQIEGGAHGGGRCVGLFDG
jgi:hypothetical protein